MATNPGQAPRPSGVEGDGMDPYPTYHDGVAGSDRVTPGAGLKPTDTALPRSRRSSGLPIFLGLIVFALAIIAYLVMGGYNALRTTNDAMTPGRPAAPAAGAPAGGQNADDTAGSGTFDRNDAAQKPSGPGAVSVTPGVTDVPGGATTTPAQTTPATTAPAQ